MGTTCHRLALNAMLFRLALFLLFLSRDSERERERESLAVISASRSAHTNRNVYASVENLRSPVQNTEHEKTNHVLFYHAAIINLVVFSLLTVHSKAVVLYCSHVM